MKFDRLNSSIALNAKEEPSIYMAICMIESLFRDVEDASGKELSRTPVGDEQLPTKMIWLGRQLLKIYSENSEDMVRNRDRLEKMMEKVKEQEKSLADTERTASALHEARIRAAALDRQLREAEAAGQEVQRLEAESKQVRERLKLLEGLDPAAVRAELEQLSARERELNAKRAELKQELERQYDAVNDLELVCEELENNTAQCRDRLERLRSEKQAAEGELDGLKVEIDQQESELSAHGHDKDKLIEEQAFLEHQLTQLRRELEDYEREQMAPIRAEYAEKSEQRDGLKAQLDALKRDRDDAVLQVARLTQQVTSAKAALDEKQQVLQQRQQAAQLASDETEKLQARLDEETNRLADLQELAADLEQNQLPQLETLIQEQTQQNKQLEDSVSGLEDRREKLSLEVERLKEDDAALSAEVAKLKEIHDELVASSEANDEAIQNLRRNVEELRGRNDQEKETRYRQQLEDEKQKLIILGQNCTELERQLESSRTNLERKEQQLSALQSKKQEADEANRKVNALVQEIAPLGDSALQRKVTTLLNRQRLLEDSYRKVEESLNMMQSALNLPEGSLVPTSESLSESLQLCGRTLDKLQKSLIRCANAVKNEITLESDRGDRK